MDITRDEYYWPAANARGVATGVDIGIYTPQNQPK